MGTGQCMDSWRSSRQHQHRPVQATGRWCQWVGTGLLEAELIRPSLAPEPLALCKWHGGEDLLATSRSSALGAVTGLFSGNPYFQERLLK